LNKIDLAKQVINRINEIVTIKSIILISKSGQEYEAQYQPFINMHENYIYPKDAEINRLKAIIEELKIQ